MTISGVALVFVPFTSPSDSLYQFVALGIVFLGVPVYFVTIRGILKPKIFTKLNGKFCTIECVNVNNIQKQSFDSIYVEIFALYAFMYIMYKHLCAA